MVRKHNLNYTFTLVELDCIVDNVEKDLLVDLPIGADVAWDLICFDDFNEELLLLH